MSSANLAHINPDILTWALKRAGMSPDALSGSDFTAEQIKNWEQGIARPTHPQAEQLAEKLRIPFLVLFLSTPPEIDIPIPDLRTARGAKPRALSPEFAEVINDVMLRQDWYKQFQIDTKRKAMPFVGRFTINDNIQAVANDIGRSLGIDDEFREQCANWKEFLARAVEKTEELGILVFRSALVRHATRRKLSAKEFRGFVLSDSIAPVIFINDDDAKAAQIFTLAHELAHIWTGETGILELDLKKRSSELHNSIERFCDRVAAEVLVPSATFASHWSAGKPINQNIEAGSRFYRVSSLVILKRAYELNKITYDKLSPLIDSEYARFRAQDKRENQDAEKKRTGGNFWASFVIRNSARFTDSIITAARSGYVRYVDAASLLGVRPATLDNFIGRFYQGVS
ncbi:MAG: ImmA/IrrE family metallo-endopeptidase [Acidobacteria bacterium]|nr:ImmA/IrrE family metallo-endopeptidase [Acidobacteriota bacterium]